MVRRRETDDLTAHLTPIQRSGYARDHRNLQVLRPADRWRQNPRQAGGQKRLPGIRAGHVHQQIMPACRGDFECARFAVSWPLTSLQVGTIVRLRRRPRLRRGQNSLALEMVEQGSRDRPGARYSRHCQPTPLPAPDGAGANQAELLTWMHAEPPAKRRGLRASRPSSDNSPDNDIARREFRHRPLPWRPSKRQRDRQIIMRPFLGQVRGREIDR